MATNNFFPINKLTEDLAMEIFHRLPVKSLLRSKSVSKTWCSLISNPNFIKSHFNRTLAASEADQTLIVHKLSGNSNDRPSISLLHVASGRLVADLNYPCLPGEFSSVQTSLLVGSANGLVCVCIGAASNRYSSSFVSQNTKTYIWNPATKQSKLIPPCCLLDHKILRNAVSYGFGYDPIHDDFKVVRVLSPKFSAEVYSLKRDVWKVLEEPIDIPNDDAFDVCVKGFLCCTGEAGTIVAFDLTNEVFNCNIEFPVDIFGAHLIEVHDSVGVVLGEDMKSNSDNDSDMESNSEIRLWTLDDLTCLRRDGGVEASWTLMFRIDVNLLSLNFVHGYFNGGYLLVLADDGIWFLVNKDTNEKRPVPLLINTRQVYKYTESMTPIAGSQLDRSRCYY